MSKGRQVETELHGDCSRVLCACVLCLSLQNEPRLKSRTSTEELSGVSLKALKVDRKKCTRREEQMEGEQKVKDAITSG